MAISPHQAGSAEPEKARRTKVEALLLHCFNVQALRSSTLPIDAQFFLELSRFRGRLVFVNHAADACLSSYLIGER